MTIEEENEMLDKVLAMLSEHFDSCQLHVTKLNPNGSTSSKHRGIGNFYARKELCREFISLDQDYELARAISNQIKE